MHFMTVLTAARAAWQVDVTQTQRKLLSTLFSIHDVPICLMSVTDSMPSLIPKEHRQFYSLVSQPLITLTLLGYKFNRMVWQMLFCCARCEPFIYLFPSIHHLPFNLFQGHGPPRPYSRVIGRYLFIYFISKFLNASKTPWFLLYFIVRMSKQYKA